MRQSLKKSALFFLAIFTSLSVLCGSAPAAKFKPKAKKKSSPVTGLKPLTSGKFAFTYPRFSPDGKHIVLSSNKNKLMHLWTMTDTGGALKEITRMNNDLAPAYSPDGKQIAFHSYGDQKTNHIFAIWITDASGPAKPKRFIEGPQGEGRFPCWQPDGRGLVWTHEKQIWIAGQDGQGAKALTNPAARGFEFCGKFSPQGDRLAYLAADSVDWSLGPSYHLWTIKKDGTDQKEISKILATRVVAWSKSGDAIYYQLGPTIFKVSVSANTAPLKVLSFRGADGTNLDLSADRRWLAYDDTTDEFSSTAQIFKINVDGVFN